MPEGPSIVILKEAVKDFKGKKVARAGGITKTIDTRLLNGKIITGIKSWGKHLLICFPDLTVRIHLMMFGTYRINERKETNPRLSLQFEDGTELNFYTCSLKFIEGSLDEVYDWTADVMNSSWDAGQAIRKLKANPETPVCDALLNQDIFAGVGNIIKNEVLFRTKIHPLSLSGSLPDHKLNELISEAVNYSYDFLEWKKEFTLKKHWLAHTKKVCPRDKAPFKKEYLGKHGGEAFTVKFAR